MMLSKQGYDVAIRPWVKILKPENVSVGNHVMVGDFVHIDVNKLQVGNQVDVYPLASLIGNGDVQIGNYVTVCSGVRILSALGQDVVIGNHVIIGENSVIMPGVLIEDGVQIMPGSVVFESCKQRGVFQGNPAKRIGKREKIFMEEKREEPLVSICCLTYNHAKLIREAMNGFLAQRTSFPVEIIVHDDASTDGTQTILQEYLVRHPEKIRLLLAKENQFTKTGKYPVNAVYQAARGKYVAECDGDDYWADPFKLQKQVEFMEGHPDFVMCHHDYQINNRGIAITKIALKGNDYTPEELIGYKLEGHGIGHCTKLWRNIYQQAEKDFQALIGDYSLNVLMGMYGRCKYLDTIKPSIYRRMHGGNSWSNLSPEEMRKQVFDLYQRIHDYIATKGNARWTAIRQAFLASPQKEVARIVRPIPKPAPVVPPQNRNIVPTSRITPPSRNIVNARKLPPDWR